MLAAPGRRVIAVETDGRLAAGLRARVASEPGEWAGVEVVEADILQFDFSRIEAASFRVYGSLPYYITSPILHRLFERAARIASIHIVIQFEVAARIAARPGRREYGYLSAACQFYTRPEIVLRIPPGAFRPPPRVASALVRMALPGEGAGLGIRDEGSFLKFVQECFGQKRKTLRNNLLRALTGGLERALPRDRGSTPRDDEIAAALAKCGIRPDARAEHLSLAQFAALFRELCGAPSGSLETQFSP